MFDQICWPSQSDNKGEDGSSTATKSSSSVSVIDDIDDEELLVSPFIAYEDGYNWPSAYTEIDEMMEACILIYPLAELRRQVRDKEMEDTTGLILQTPLTRSQIMDVIETNEEAITKASSKFGDEFYRDVLKTVQERNMVAKARAESRKSGHTVHITAASIIAFDDKFEQEELVYSIEADVIRKRITVCFRGSVTKLDWATDFEIYMKDVSNPLQSHISQEPTIRVHHGFHDYLFGPSSRGAKGPNGEDLSEYQEIMQQHVLPVLKQYPGFKLYVTGHSLGAALATLFAFEAAAEPDTHVPKPVSLFSIAGPYVGDESFRSAHQLLESLGKLRHIRVSNHKDLVTIVPKVSWRFNVFGTNSHVGALFKHVGVNLRFYEGTTTPVEISYPRVRSGFFSSTFDELARGWDQSYFSNISWNPMAHRPFHGLREYNKRLEANKSLLEQTYVNDLYARKNVVGNLVPHF
eukprot:CAMPEP_0198282834 /NCGR_PEP_ID=MMETSP1449-20131203/2585_1 /TAXON_ID=420275 /ORGANISM="Attheya septentrionalis, Strain CCMP2084" /LENGTH=463 /DNA_ID=CAMNT_0043979249 /DNA_START=113 /DNA_END=1504 /DNA_ORIENTATION=-